MSEQEKSYTIEVSWNINRNYYHTGYNRAEALQKWINENPNEYAKIADPKVFAFGVLTGIRNGEEVSVRVR
jgi:hypothetical protein